jgi:hypothetical protein
MSSYSNFSPYYKTPEVNGHLDILSLRDIPAASDDVLFEVTQTYSLRPDLLAYDLYNDSRLWWVFAVRNKDIIQDSTYDLVAGQRIYIPSLPNLQSIGIL